MSKIYYYAPESNKPSWGIGIIYYHVSLLVKNGYQAHILLNRKEDKPDWLKIKVPIAIIEYSLSSLIREKDILVIPEVCMRLDWLKLIKCKKIVFIQAPGYIFESMPEHETHKTLGFSEVFTIMPHLLPIINEFVKLPVHLIPPFVPDIFQNLDINRKRKKQIILYPKFHQIDYTIVRKLLKDKLEEKKKKVLGIFQIPEWEILELKNLKHSEIPEIMAESEIFISLNCFEALNTSVVEAMAAGCIIFTYEGFGPRDYLRNNENAFVFGNNEAYKLVSALFEFIDTFDERQEECQKLRLRAKATANQYTIEKMESALISVFYTLLKETQN